MTQVKNSKHEFKSSWRWPEDFENWAESIIGDTDGLVVNVCAGLSPLGDVRVDVKNPVELVENLQGEDHIGADRAREYMTDLVIGNPQKDVITSLFNSNDPANHPAAEHIKTNNTVRADALDDLPFADNSFEWTISDPPWLDLSVDEKSRLFSELVRITEPGGHILFNSYWTPTPDGPVTLDYMATRQDLCRWAVGTPNISWVGVYTVHDSLETAQYLSSTLTSREYEPTPDTFEEAVRAKTVFELNHIHGFNNDDYDTDIVDPTVTDAGCPKCSCSSLDPIGENVLDAYRVGDLYECPDCGFRALPEEAASEQCTGAKIKQGQEMLTSPTTEPQRRAV